MQRGTHTNRIRVAVRSCVNGEILRWVSEREAREMCDEDSHGDPLCLREAIALRLSRKKAALQDIRLLAPVRSEHSSSASLTASDSRRNAWAKLATKAHLVLDPSEAMRPYDLAEAKIAAWPEIHDDKAVIVCAGVVHSPQPARL